MKKILLLLSVLFTCWQINAQYCVPAALPTGCTAGDTIDDFTIPAAGFSHLGTGCSANNYGDFTADATLQIDLAQATPYDFEIDHGFGNQQVKIWVDFNVDQVFDATEVIFTSPGNADPTIGSFSIPTTVATGLTRMRVINIYFQEPSDPCTPAGTFGEVHDYTVNILPPPPCPDPTDVASVDVFFDSIEASWTAVANATDGYLWEVYAAGDDPAVDTPASTGTFPAGTTQGIAGGLMPETNYEFYLAADCGATDGVSGFAPSVAFTTSPTCSLPSTFDVSNILPDSAELSWTSIPNATNGYNWAVFNAGDDPATATPVSSGNAPSTDTSVVVTGLSDNTNYEAYITTDCGTDGLSAQSSALSFVTPCIALVAPITENFDGSNWVSGTGFGNTGSQIENCWSRNPVAPAFFWGTRTGATGSTGTGPDTANSGANYIFTEGSNGITGDEAFLESPLIDLSALTDPALTFWYHMSGADMGTLSVDVDAGSGYDLNVFTISGEQQPNTSDPFTEQITDLSAYAGQTVRIRFRGIRGGGFASDMAIDDFSVDEAPSCLAPSGLVASNITANSVDISWGAVGNATVGYNWLVFADGADPAVDTPLFTGSVGTGITNTTINGLTGATDYDLYIQSDCGTTDGLSELSNAVSILTLCDIFIPDYLESFDNYLPNCWDEAGSGDPTTGPSDFGNSLWLHDQFLNATGANNSVNINLFTTNREDWIISPTFDLSGDVYILQYIAAVTDFANSNPPELNGMGSDDEVQVLITEDNGVTWTSLKIYNQTSFPSETGDIEIIDLSSYTGNVRFAFWGTDGSVDDTEDYDFFIDEFEVKVAPSCLQPLNFTATNETTTSIDISWDAEANATSGYIWSVFNPGDDPLVDTPVFTGTVAAGVTSETITGLNSSTSYVVYVQSDCGTTDGLSDFSNGVEFQTLCDVFTTPYFEDFEDFAVTTTLVEDECWEEVSQNAFAWDVSTGGTPSTATGPTGALFGSNYIFTEASSGAAGNEAIILTPQVDLSALTTPALSFWYHMYGGDIDVLHIDVDNGTTLDLSVDSIIGEQQTDNTDPWEERIIDLSAYAGQTVQVRFRVVRGGSFNGDVALDGVRFDEAPTCFTPLNLSVTNITETSADFSWDDETTASDGFNWFIFTAGDDPDVDTPLATGSVAAGVTTVSVSGLPSSSFLQFYVQSDCGASGTSFLSVPLAFETLCDAFPTPYFEDFANFTVTTNFIEDGCWTEASPSGFAWDVESGQTPSVGTGPDGAEFGANYIFTESSTGSLGDEAIVLTPLVDLTNLTAPALSFWYHMFGADMGTLHVDVDDGTNLDLSVFSISGQQQTSLTDPWVEQFIDLSAYAGQTIQVRFRVERGGGFTSDVAIDGVNFDEAPPCLKPTGLALVEVFFDTAEVTWSGVGNATTGYNWAVFNAGDDPLVDTPVSTGTFPAGSTQGIVGGLSPETDYDVYIESDCGADGTSGFANPISITTTPLCSVPSTFDVINLLPDSAELTWTAIPNATGYNWAVFNAGDDPTTATPVASGTAPITDTSVVATGLTDNTSYDAYITTDCGTDGFSDQSSAVTFLTPCTIFATPFFEDFETFAPSTSFDFAQCWTEVSPGLFDWNISNGGTPSLNTGPNQALSGTNFLYTEASSGVAGNEALFVSPLIDLSSLNDPALSFWYHMFGVNMGTLYVDIDAGSGYDLAVFSLSGPQQAAQTDPWIEQFVDLAAYAGQTVQVRFRGERGSSFEGDISIDDVRVDEAPSCLTPTGLAVSNITANSVDISWSPVGNALTGYNWLVFAAGADPDVDSPLFNGSVGPGVTSTTITGINPATVYDVYIQSNCGAVDGVSELSPGVTFQTLCATIQTPYFNDFENFTPTTTFVEQECWLEVSPGAFDWNVTNTDTPSGGTGPDQAFSGVNFLYVEASSGTLGNEALLESPSLDLAPLAVPALSFWYHMFGGDMGVLHVDVDAGTGYDLDVFTLSGEQQTSEGEDWIQQFVDLSAYAGQSIVIRIRVERGNGFEGDVSIDDVRVDEAPTCFDPNSLEVLSVTDTSANLNWVAGSSETIFDVEVVLAGATPTGVPTFEDVTLPFTATGLMAETDYDFYVRADCGAGDVSNWVGPEGFTTVFTPTTVIVNDPAINESYCYGNSEIKEWLFVASDGVTPVEIQFTEGQIEDDPDSSDRFRVFDGFDTNAPVLYDSDVDGKDLSGVSLTANSGSAYLLLESDIFGSCQGGIISLIAFDFDVFAGTVATTAFSESNFNFYPNPVRSILNIESANPIDSVQIFDILGKEVLNNNYNASSFNINLQELSSGTYLMKVNIGDSYNTYKIVKE